MPDDSLESFGVGCDIVWIHGGDNYTGIRLGGSVAAIFADNADHPSADLFRELDS